MVETRSGVEHPWAAELPVDEALRAATLRRERGVEALVVGDRLWLRGVLIAEDERALLRLLPGVRPYRLAADGQLTRAGNRVPTARLPTGAWRPLGELLDVRLPQAHVALAGRPACVPLELVRGGPERAAALLLTSLEAWAAYAETAPRWRVECLAFAADGRGRVLLRGSPLPPVRGTQWWEAAGIAAPVGWHWCPAIEPRELRELLRLDEGDVALLMPRDGTLDRGASSIPMATCGAATSVVRRVDWVRATRSAVRRTAAVREAAP